MARQFITTVGTSLLTNRDDRRWAGWNGRTGDPLPPRDEVDQWLASADLEVASAETNTLRCIGISPEDQIRLLHSDTPEGRFCSERLQTLYTSVMQCRQVDARPLTSLGYDHGSFSQKGLRALVNEATAAVRDAHRMSLVPVFSATGGFKAEIAFLNLLGALLDVEVYYIHEKFRDIVRLPRLPLKWDTDWILQHRKFFEWIDDEPRRTKDVASRLKANPDIAPLVEAAEDGNSYLNAAGHLVFTAANEVGPRAVWPPPAAKPPGKKNGLSNEEHHRPRGWQAFVARLCEIDCVRRVSYDAKASGGHAVKVLDSSSGIIGIRFGSTDLSLPLRVETTASSSVQTDLVRDYLETEILHES